MTKDFYLNQLRDTITEARTKIKVIEEFDGQYPSDSKVTEITTQLTSILDIVNFLISEQNNARTQFHYTTSY